MRAIAPLPYRRVLSKHELATIWQRVEQRWGITAKMDWYPLHDVPLPSHVIALQEDWFAYAIPPDVLREILIQHGILRVWELSQGDVSSQYEMDVTWLVPWSSAVEHCWTSERMDWMIYTSHEHSITLGGEWFLERIKYMWPEWKEHIYAGYRYALPPPFESSNLAPLLQFRSTSTSAEQAGFMSVGANPRQEKTGPTTPSGEVVSSLLDRLKEPSGDWDAIQELVALGSSAVPLLIRALTDDSEALNVRLGIIAALRDIPDERIIEPLISVCNLMNREGEVLDHLIIPAFVQFGVRAVTPLVNALMDRQRDVLIRAAAARALGALREPEVLEVLVERVKDVNEASRVRSLAALGLGDLGDRWAVVPLMDILKQEADEDVRQGAAAALGPLGDPRAVDLLIEILETDQSSNVQGWVARSLGLIGNERAIWPLIEAIASLRGGYLAIEALAQFGAPALQALLRALQDPGRKPPEHENLVGALGHFKQKEAFARLLAILEDESESRVVRMRIASTLMVRREQRAGKSLLALLENRKEALSLRVICAYALGTLKYQRALPALQEILQDENTATPEENELKRVAERVIRMINR